MNKKFFVLAFVSAAFFLSCSADGTFESGEPSSVKWSKDNKSSNSNPGPNPSSSSGDETMYCHIGPMCYEITALMPCISSTPSSTPCPDPIPED